MGRIDRGDDHSGKAPIGSGNAPGQLNGPLPGYFAENWFAYKKSVLGPILMNPKMLAVAQIDGRRRARSARHEHETGPMMTYWNVTPSALVSLLMRLAKSKEGPLRV